MLTDEEIADLLTKCEQVVSTSELKGLESTYLGAEGLVRKALQAIKNMSADERKTVGPVLQEQKHTLEQAFSKAQIRLETAVTSHRRGADLSAVVPKIGHAHPLSETIERLNGFFARLGFSVYDGPEIETDDYNFQRLNVPKDHPAREMQDTIYIDAPNILLRTQTSSLEARALATLRPPFRVVCPGRVYRNEKPNKSNHFVFHHYQGIVVQERTSLAELFGTFEALFKFMYGEKVVMRFRSKFYPEVEPGVGPDMRCFNCQGQGCAVCKQVGWIEMGGAGIIHKNILRMAGVDTDKYMGFAFALGLDRWVMAKYNITDIRTLLAGGLAYPYFESENFYEKFR